MNLDSSKESWVLWMTCRAKLFINTRLTWTHQFASQQQTPSIFLIQMKQGHSWVTYPRTHRQGWRPRVSINMGWLLSLCLYPMEAYPQLRLSDDTGLCPGDTQTQSEHDSQGLEWFPSKCQSQPFFSSVPAHSRSRAPGPLSCWLAWSSLTPLLGNSTLW